jgi:hypothetical protein
MVRRAAELRGYMARSNLAPSERAALSRPSAGQRSEPRVSEPTRGLDVGPAFIGTTRECAVPRGSTAATADGSGRLRFGAAACRADDVQVRNPRVLPFDETSPPARPGERAIESTPGVLAFSDMSSTHEPLGSRRRQPAALDNRRALERGSLTAVRAAVANLPGPPPLDDALVICHLLLDQEPDRYERAAVRWLGRLLLEQRGVSLRHAELAAAYLAAWADPAGRDAATEALGELGRAVGLRRLGTRLASAGGH